MLGYEPRTGMKEWFEEDLCMDRREEEQDLTVVLLMSLASLFPAGESPERTSAFQWHVDELGLN